MGLLNITESERREILNLHNNAKIIKEQATSLTAPVAPTGTASPTSTQTVEDVIKEFQTVLNTQYGAKLTVDGKWGNLTQIAFENAVKSKSAAPAAGTTPAPAAGTTPAPAAGTTPAPAAGTTPAPAAGNPADVVGTPVAQPQTNRDQRRDRQDMRRGQRRDRQDLRAQQRTQ